MADLTQFQQDNGGAGAFQFLNGSGLDAQGKEVAAPVAPTPAPVASTSQTYRQGISDLGQDINQGLTSSPLDTIYGPGGRPDTSGLTSDYNDVKGNLTARQDQLKTEQQGEIDSINAQFNQERQQLEHTQANETGAFSNTLARIGGYLGESASGQGAMVNLQNVHNQQIDALESKRRGALGQAQAAYNDKNFQLANSLIQESKDYHNQILQAQKDFSDTRLKYLDSQRADKEFQLKQQQAQLEKQRAAQEFALKYRIPADKPFYSIGGTVYRTADQEPAPNPEAYTQLGGKGDFSDVFPLTGNAGAEQDMVMNFAKEYPDAGITASDTLATASQKIKGSNLYQSKLDKPLKYTDANGHEQFYDPITHQSTGFGGSFGNPVGQIQGLPAFNTAQSSPGVNRPTRNNNPGNIKLSATTAKYDGVVGVEANPAADGGNFLVFDSPESGLKAMQQLLFGSNVYQSLTLDQAMRKWSGGAYGAEVAPNIDKHIQVGDIPEEVRDGLIQKIAKREGFNPGAARSAKSDIQEIAQGIINGNQPPDMKGLYSKSAAVRAELERQGYNLTKANQDWTATQKYLTTLNGSQQVRLRQAVDFASESLPVVEQLNDQWSRSNFPILNKAQITAAKNGALGPEAQQIATKIDSQISDLISELGTVYKGGNSSTDESLKLAAQQLSSDWSHDQLQSAIDLIKQNLRIRRNSLTAAGVAGVTNNQYQPGASSDASALNDINFFGQ